MSTKKQRYMISVDDDMFNAIEDFRFENRYQTRSQATTELIRLGLKVLEKKDVEDKENKLTPENQAIFNAILAEQKKLQSLSDKQNNKSLSPHYQ